MKLTTLFTTAILAALFWSGVTSERIVYLSPKQPTISSYEYDDEYTIRDSIYRMFQDSVFRHIEEMVWRETGDSSFRIKRLCTSKCRKSDHGSHHKWTLFLDGTWWCAVDINMLRSPLPISNRYVMEFIKQTLNIDQVIWYDNHLHIGFWACNNRNEFKKGIEHRGWTEYKTL